MYEAKARGDGSKYHNHTSAIKMLRKIACLRAHRSNKKLIWRISARET